MPDLAVIMHKLARTRPVFHSEADFQHALAWELHAAVPDAHIRLEYRPLRVERMYLDIWLRTGTGPTAIELKYITRRFLVAVAGEQFELLDHGAQPPHRYAFIKDLARLERVVDAIPGASAAAILLTNDDRYWTAPRPGDRIDAALRIHEGRLLHGTLGWSPQAGEGTIKGKKEPLALRGAYRVRWQDYAVVDGDAGHFRYLMLDVLSPQDVDRTPFPQGDEVISTPRG